MGGPRMTSSDRDMLVRLWGDLEVTQVDIAVRLRKSVETVRKIAHDMGLPRRKSRHVNGILQASIALRQELTPWPADMPSFEDHPDCHDPVKDMGLRGRPIYGSWPYRIVSGGQSSMGDRQC